jgi:hypothetical protein
MVSVHIWCQNNCQGIQNFDKYFQKFTEERTRFNTPIIHKSFSKLNNDQLTKITYSILNHRETPNLQILIISNNDFQALDEHWLPGSIRTLCGVAEICPGTSIICLNLITDDSLQRKEVRERVRRIFASSFKHFYVDLGQELEQSDLSTTQCLSDIGVRKLTRSLIRIILKLPASIFLD